MIRRIVGAAALIVLCVTTAQAQQEFGQNQVQYDHFTWSVKETPHFQVFYYPSERELATIAAEIAEKAYDRYARVLGHQFREKKPIILYASRSDFGQNNVTGDLGEGTGGVTEGLRQRVLVAFTGDLGSFNHVLTHELVHSFQYDIFSNGRADNGLERLENINPPLWYVEGMAEYLSIGPGQPLTDAWMRDAAINGTLPTIAQMTADPDKYFPYRYGQSLWEYVAGRWGEQVIGRILLATPGLGVNRAFVRETGMSLDDLSDEWREAMQAKYLPQLATLERPRKFATAMLTNRRSGGDVFNAPDLSPDGKYIAFLSQGSFLKGQVFFDLWLADAHSGKRITRLVKSTTDPHFEELGLLYSQSAFSPDSKLIAFTAMEGGHDVLYVMDVAKRKVITTADFKLERLTSPTFSPDSRRVAFSGGSAGGSDLYIMDVNGQHLEQLTNDRYADLQPQWSPDGNTLAFVSDRGPATNFDSLRFGNLSLALFNLKTSEITIPEGQGGLTINPMWAPDGNSIAYVSDRTGIANLYLYNLATHAHYQLTNIAGSISGITEFSPAISWARGADRLAFTYFENGDYTIWSIDNPRALMREPFKPAPEPPKVIAQATPAPTPASVQPAVIPADTARVASSFYRGDDGTVRRSADVPLTRTRPPAGVLSATTELADTSKFKDHLYKASLQAEEIEQPTIGYTGTNSYGAGVYGGTGVVFGDMLDNQQLAVFTNLNGRLSQAEGLAQYVNVSRRWQYVAAVDQEPYSYLSSEEVVPSSAGPGLLDDQLTVSQITLRAASFQVMYPFNRFTRLEGGLSFDDMDRNLLLFSQTFDPSTGDAGQFYLLGTEKRKGLIYEQPSLSFVSDNALIGPQAAVAGRRYRFTVQPAVGSIRWMGYFADYRRYDPILFDFLTVATRLYTAQFVGRDEELAAQYIGRPDLIRGYNRETYTTACQSVEPLRSTCGPNRLIGSRIALANVELRFPLLRSVDLGVISFPLPLIDGLIFYDVGAAWSDSVGVRFKPSPNLASSLNRYPLRSYGAGLRLNLFGYALLHWDYAIPLDDPIRKGFWTFSIGESY